MKTTSLASLRQAAFRRLALLACSTLSLVSARATLNGTFQIVSGDAHNISPTGGAVWTYITPQGVLDDGDAYNLRGILFAPETNPYGSGPFPAVIVNHGLGETAEPDGTNHGYVIQCACSSTDDSRGDFVHAGPTGSQGVVVIGVNLTHTGHSLKNSFLPAGDVGASDANIKRIRKVQELLANHPYFNPTTGTIKVDGARLVIHGHSMGAYATAATVGTPRSAFIPAEFIVASHTAGGVNDSRLEATKTAQANGISIPYQMHHGLGEIGNSTPTCKVRVPYAEDRTLRDILVANNGAQNVDLHEYSNICHQSYFPDSADTGGQNGLNSWGEIEMWWINHNLFVSGSANTAPTISNIADQTINQNGNTGALAFTVGDAETAAGSLTVSGSSSNTTLVPNANIVFGGSGANRTVTVTPATGQSGSATITVTVSDGSLTAQDTFLLTVNSGSVTVNFTSEGGNDGWLLESSPGNNTADRTSNPVCGNSNTNSAGALRIGDDAGNRQFRSIVSFNVTGLPAGAVIDSATLKFVRSGIVGNPSGFGTSFNAAIKGGSGFANSSALQWGATTNDFSNGSGATPDLAAAVTGLSTSGTTTTGTLTSGALALLGNGRFQFRIDFPTKTVNAGSQDYVGFYSGENATAGNRPVLSITYHVP